MKLIIIFSLFTAITCFRHRSATQSRLFKVKAANPIPKLSLSIGSAINLNRVSKTGALVAAISAIFALWIRQVLWIPSRKYNKEANSVGREYDAWTAEGILEYYWGEHIHLGYYTEEDRRNGYKNKDFKEAKFDFVDQMVFYF